MVWIQGKFFIETQSSYGINIPLHLHIIKENKYYLEWISVHLQEKLKVRPALWNILFSKLEETQKNSTSEPSFHSSLPIFAVSPDSTIFRGGLVLTLRQNWVQYII